MFPWFPNPTLRDPAVVQMRLTAAILMPLALFKFTGTSDRVAFTRSGSNKLAVSTNHTIDAQWEAVLVLEIKSFAVPVLPPRISRASEACRRDERILCCTEQILHLLGCKTSDRKNVPNISFQDSDTVRSARTRPWSTANDRWCSLLMWSTGRLIGGARCARRRALGG